VSALSAIDKPQEHHVLPFAGFGSIVEPAGLNQYGKVTMLTPLLSGSGLFDFRASFAEPAPIDVDVVIDLACQLMDAVTHAVNCGVLHRDISPCNVFIDAEGNG
jgi:serine/threonine protein kinase